MTQLGNLRIISRELKLQSMNFGSVIINKELVQEHQVQAKEDQDLHENKHKNTRRYSDQDVHKDIKEDTRKLVIILVIDRDVVFLNGGIVVMLD